EEIAGQCSKIKLDEEHQRFIQYLNESHASFWWDQDHHMLVAHTYNLAEAHKQLKMRGVFKTVATGKDQGHDWNCYLFPMRRGAWVVRRFTPGIKEDNSWDQDNNGWTRCFLNRDSDLRTAVRAKGGLEDEGNVFVFRHGSDAQSTALTLGTDISLPPKYQTRRTTLKQHKDGKRIIVEFDRLPEDTQDELQGWLVAKSNKWRKIFNSNLQNTVENDIGNYDDVIRHLIVNESMDCGWAVKVDTVWHDEPLTHIKHALESLNLKAPDIKSVLGNSVFKPWKLINLPFQPEYPGDRQWNRNSCQLRFVPNLTKEKLTYNHWSKILNHIGKNLDEAILSNEWCKNNGLIQGSDYLKCWIASLFQCPSEPLPYLFLYGPQNSGKSILHEALGLLVNGRGICRADHALTSASGFNAELENSILCVVEETDLKHNKQAYNRIKDWVTSIQIAIRKLFTNLYTVNNTTHWIHCANERSACPIFPGDTRIVMCYVGELENSIPKSELLYQLEKEAPDFLAEILKLEIPKSQDRLNLPVVETGEKTAAAKANQTLLETFVDECCYIIPGEMMLYSDFYDAFNKWLEPNDRYEWSKIKVGRSLPQGVVKGRNPQTAQWCLGNISFEQLEPTQSRIILRGDKLYHE
ncbi:MAG: primase-helicase family protein, partial [Methanomassiliicoccales archaeon]